MKNVSIIQELFKRVRIDEILDDLKELGVHVQYDTFKQPKCEDSLGLYSLAIQIIYGKTIIDIRPEDLYNKLKVLPIDINGLNYNENDIEFLKCGIGNLRLWRYCQRLHESLGLNMIQRFELFNPTSESFIKFITSFIVYLRFREALYNSFEIKISSLDLLAERNYKLTHDVKLMNDEYNKLKSYKNNLNQNNNLIQRKNY